jgi:hypothetical protein
VPSDVSVAQLAAACGVHVLGLVRRAEGVEELAAAGIEGVVATDQDGWRERALEITVALHRRGRRLGRRRRRAAMLSLSPRMARARRLRRDGVADDGALVR